MMIAASSSIIAVRERDDHVLPRALSICEDGPLLVPGDASRRTDARRPGRAQPLTA